MKRSVRALCLAIFAALAAPAAAQDGGSRMQDAIIAQLSDQGFTRVRISNTILGRVRLLATSPDATREIIFNPRTGEILRDYWDDRDDAGSGPVSSSGSGTRGDSVSGSDDDDGDDDDRDVDRDDDRDDDDRDDDRDDDDDKDDDDDDDDDDDKDDD